MSATVGLNGEREGSDFDDVLIGTVMERRPTNRSGASEVRVSVSDNGNGPAVNVRKWITSLPNGDVTKRRKMPYVGPTREGVWIPLTEDAYALADLIVRAALEVEERNAEEAA